MTFEQQISNNHTNGFSIKGGQLELKENDIECLLNLIRQTNGFLTRGHQTDAVPFYTEGKVVGLVKEAFVPFLLQFPEVFVVERSKANNGYPGKITGLSLSNSLNSCEARTAALRIVANELRQHSDILVALKGWRDEDYAAYDHFHDSPLFHMERAASCLLGLRRYGVHINGFVRNSHTGVIEKMWIAQRSLDKPTYPGLLDNMAAGGLTSGYRVIDVAKKELREEASCPEEFFHNLKSAGVLCYCYEDARGICPENLFVFDIELPHNFTPLNSDGEVDRFVVKSIPEVFRLILQPNFKPNSALVILDFLIRHGFITPEDTPYYGYLVHGMHIDPFAHLFPLVQCPNLV